MGGRPTQETATSKNEVSFPSILLVVDHGTPQKPHQPEHFEKSPDIKVIAASNQHDDPHRPPRQIESTIFQCFEVFNG